MGQSADVHVHDTSSDMKPIDPSTLRAGDVILYRPQGFIGWCIASRTFSNWAHVEVSLGSGVTVASRNFVGVGLYAFNPNRVGRVIRPRGPLNMVSAMGWFDGVVGQRYDYWAIMRFLLPHCIRRDLDMTRQICSSFAVRFLREAGVDVVAADMDADLVAPSTIAASASCDVVWSDEI
jgi:hypothetical protein